MQQEIIDLYDTFTHGGMNRRQFIDRLTALAGSTAAATAVLGVLQNDYARAATIEENDPRIRGETVTLGEGSSKISGYLVKPKDGGRLPAVLVIHENRGLNPHIRDVARRVAVAGFTAFAADYLTPLGGTPTDEDKAREMIGTLKAPDVVAMSKTAVAELASRADTTGKVGAIGFCWGGGQVNQLAVKDPGLSAGVAYYGGQPAAVEVPAIKAAMLLHYGGLDERINAGIPAYEAALKDAGKIYQIHVYQGANHAFNNDTNAARYDKAAADLAWERTIAWLKTYTA